MLPLCDTTAESRIIACLVRIVALWTEMEGITQFENELFLLEIDIIGTSQYNM